MSPRRCVMDADLALTELFCFLLLIGSVVTHALPVSHEALRLLVRWGALGLGVCVALSVVLTLRRYEVVGGRLVVRPLGLNRLLGGVRRIELRGARLRCRFPTSMLEVEKDGLRQKIRLPALGRRHGLWCAIVDERLGVDEQGPSPKTGRILDVARPRLVYPPH